MSVLISALTALASLMLLAWSLLSPEHTDDGANRQEPGIPKDGPID